MTINKTSYALTEVKPNENVLVERSVEEANVTQTSGIQLRLYPDALDKNSTLLLYLKNPANSAQLFITDMLGNTVNVPMKGVLQGGFYEISLLPKQPTGGVYVVRLIIDGKIYSRRIIR